MLSLPSVPRSFTATAGDGRVRLKWANPFEFRRSRSRPSVRHQYRYTPGATVPDGTAWSNPTKPPFQHRQLFAGLTNGTAHAFEVRAVNAVGASPPVTATATPMTVACPAPSLGNRRQHWRGDLTIGANTPHWMGRPLSLSVLRPRLAWTETRRGQPQRHRLHPRRAGIQH